MSKINIQPLGDRVLVEQKQEAEQIKGGIVIPDSAKEKPLEAVVVALGTGKLDDKGNKIPFDVKVGDIVLTSKYGGTEVKYDDKESRTFAPYLALSAPCCSCSTIYLPSKKTGKNCNCICHLSHITSGTVNQFL